MRHWLTFAWPALTALAVSCGPVAGPDGWIDATADHGPDVWVCDPGEMRCVGNVHEWCEPDQEFTVIRSRDCTAEGLVCVSAPPLGCAPCRPGELTCHGQDVVLCEDSAVGWDVVTTCNPARGEACHDGRCVNGCEHAAYYSSNVGCVYYAVDLDNAALSFAENASAQQFAVAVSNPSDLLAEVAVEIDTAAPGEVPVVVEVDRRDVMPGDLEVFRLERREVDGSSMEGLDDGTHTALTARAYRIVSTAPIVVYQFNPLENVDVFSNDASILLPVTAASTEYVVLGWPQTIANTPWNPSTSMGLDLRAWLSVVGTQAGTNVRVELPPRDGLRVIGDGAGIPDLWGGDVFEAEIGEFEVLNLETADGAFGADFTGTVVTSSKPVTVFSGNEASDVPYFDSLSERRCCADHLEQQLYPASASGRTYVVGHTPYRTPAVAAAGGEVSVHEEVEWFRILALYDATTVRTTLPAPDDLFGLDRGEVVTVMSRNSFGVASDRPVTVGQFVASQENIGLFCRYPDQDLPGGDPCFILISPIEQWRDDYVFLTPSEYMFDFVTIAHRQGTGLELDGHPLPPTCETEPIGIDGEGYAVTSCQLSFPEVGATGGISPGVQDDGVHEIRADEPVGLTVYGFDCRVSYGYPGGTDLQVIE